MITKKEALVPEVVEPRSRQTELFGESRSESIIRLHAELKNNMELSLKHARISLNKIFDIGKLLTEQKSELKQGEFGRWIEKNLPFNHRTADRYMQIYRDWDKLNLGIVRNITQAYRYLKMIPHNAASSSISDPSQKSKILIIFPSPEEREPIMDALNRVMSLLGTDSLARAIYALASDWLEANDDKTAFPPLQDKIHFLEQIYNVKLTAHPKV